MESYCELLLNNGSIFSDCSRVDLQNNDGNLFIGLGGTGIDGLERLKKEIMESIRPEETVRGEYRNLKFLAIDIDENMFKRCQTSHHVLREEECFQIHKVNLGMVPPKLLTTRPELQWLDPEQMALPTNPSPNASGLRAYGRAMLMMDSQDIFLRFCHLLEDVVRNAPMRRINIHILTSAVGGTGSGIFLDVCYLLRRAIERTGMSQDTALFGYVFLPDVCLNLVHTNREQLMANGYAFLKELDYFMQVKENGGAVEQMYQGGMSIRWDRAPVDCCYLISSTDENGLSRSDGYFDALSVAAEYILENITEIPTLGMIGPLAPIAPPMLPKAENGAYRFYAVPGADTVKLPMKEIGAYLSCGLLEMFPCLDQPVDVGDAAIQVMKDAKIEFDPLWSRMRAAAGKFELSGLTAREVKMSGTDVVKHYYQKLVEDKRAQLEKCADGMMQPEGPDSLIAALHTRLDEMAANISYGPFGLLRVVQNSANVSLMLMIGGMIKKAEETAHYEKTTGSQLQERVKQAYEQFEKRKSKKNLAMLEYALMDSAQSELNFVIFEKLQRIFGNLKQQLEMLCDSRYIPLANAMERLTQTMRENRSMLDLNMKGNRGQIISIEALRPMLDNQLSGIHPQSVFAQMVQVMLNIEESRTEYETRFVKEFCNFAAGIFGNITANILPYLEEKYHTNHPAAIEMNFEKDILRMLEHTSKPALYMNPAMSVKTIDYCSLAISQGEATLMNTGSNYIGKLGTGANRAAFDLRRGLVGMRQVRFGVPLYAFWAMPEWEAVYERYERKSHISYRGLAGDFRRLPGLMPQSLVSKNAPETVLQDVEEGRALYDFALQKGLLRLEEGGKALFSQPESEWKDSLEQLLQRIAAVSEMRDDRDAQELLMQTEALLKEAQPEQIGMLLPCGDNGLCESKVVPNITCDRFVASLSCRRMAKDAMEQFERLAQAAKQLTVLVKNSAEKQEFFDALICGVIRQKGLKVNCTVENFGLEENILLSGPFMPFGRLPLYQAYLNYCLLYEGSREQIREETAKRMEQEQWICAETLQLWKNRFEWMQLEERIKIYPEADQRSILQLYNDLADAIRGVF